MKKELTKKTTVINVYYYLFINKYIFMSHDGGFSLKQLNIYFLYFNLLREFINKFCNFVLLTFVIYFHNWCRYRTVAHTRTFEIGNKRAFHNRKKIEKFY